MKFKDLKIRVPEHDRTNNGLLWSRPEIHEAIQEHAFKLGWKWRGIDTNVIHTGKRFIFFDSDSTIAWLDRDEETFQNHSATEIHWQDFLKLTKEDVTLRGWNHVGVESHGVYGTKIPYYSKLELKIGDMEELSDGKYRIGDLILFKNRARTHKCRIKLSMEVE